MNHARQPPTFCSVKKTFGIYASLAGIPLVGLLAVLQLGSRMIGQPGLTNVRDSAPGGGPSVSQGLLVLILQIGIVLIAARGAGLVVQRFGQPMVVGEMLAGILLGPSLFGWLAPGLTLAIFPPASLGILSGVSQVGLVIFMFLVGLELNPRLLRHGGGHAAVVISHASIIVPFFLGSALALYLFPRLTDGSIAFPGFALFLGAAMSITAFPVLARILREGQLTNSAIGSLAITCAAVDDVTAWCMLAVIVVLVRAPGVEHDLWVTLAGSFGYLAAVLLVGRRLFRHLETWHQRRGRVTQEMLALVLLLTLASAWTTEWLGIHALFGAFLIGAALPKGEAFVADLRHRLEDVTVVLLLPLYFAFTGLRTSIALLNGPDMWSFFSLIMLVAIAGKFGGALVAARMVGIRWRESSVIGILMNTRGLVELVILNVGLDIGVLPPAIFTMMVLMALVTTAMTGPLLELAYPKRLRQAGFSLQDLGLPRLARSQVAP
jgi:Kef-type K+ transport system membrane component KefB